MISKSPDPDNLAADTPVPPAPREDDVASGEPERPNPDRSAPHVPPTE